MLKQLFIGISFMALGALGLLRGIGLIQPRSALRVRSPDKEFVEKTYRGNLTGIRLAEMAEQRAFSDAVRQYARQLIGDQMRANTSLRRMAGEKEIELPSNPGKKGMAIEESLSQLRGPDFDREFVREQARAHKEAIGLFRTEAKNGRDRELRSYASSTLRILRQHELIASYLDSTI